MGDWLVRHFMVFGIPGQNWMPIALAVIVVGIVFARWSNR
jgi:hypothetical protein